MVSNVRAYAIDITAFIPSVTVRLMTNDVSIEDDRPSPFYWEDMI